MSPCLQISAYFHPPRFRTFQQIEGHRLTNLAHQGGVSCFGKEGTLDRLRQDSQYGEERSTVFDVSRIKWVELPALGIENYLI